MRIVVLSQLPKQLKAHPLPSSQGKGQSTDFRGRGRWWLPDPQGMGHQVGAWVQKAKGIVRTTTSPCSGQPPQPTPRTHPILGMRQRGRRGGHSRRFSWTVPQRASELAARPREEELVARQECYLYTECISEMLGSELCALVSLERTKGESDTGTGTEGAGLCSLACRP